MKTTRDTNPKTKRKLPLALAALVMAVAAGAVWVTTQANQNRNYAAEVARPLERSLTEAGAVKKCYNQDSGRGSDNTNPWYDAIYEVPGDKEAATKVVHDAFRNNGYNLTDGPTPGTPRDNTFFGDKSSKRSTFSQLEDGNVEVILTVHGSETHNGKDGYLCGVTANNNPPGNSTTIDFTVNLPEFRR